MNSYNEELNRLYASAYINRETHTKLKAYSKIVNTPMRDLLSKIVDDFLKGDK